MIRAVMTGHPRVGEVILYGSRAKGTFRPESDVDLAITGLDDDLQAEAIAADLDELPLPYQFDVRAYDAIRYGPLREHIDRVGVVLFRRAAPAPRHQESS